MEEFTREPFVHDGETVEEALAPGTARRRAYDAALAELESGAEKPSLEWRRQYSLLLGPRAPAVRGRAAPGRRHAALGPPGRCAGRHADRAQRRRHAQRQRERRNGAGPDTAELAAVGIPGEDDDEEDEPEEPQDWSEEGPTSTPTSSTGPRTRREQALLVRARDRRRQDGRRAGLRRGVAHGRDPDPHPPPQPRRPVQRRAARPRLLEPHHARAARRKDPGNGAVGRSPSRPTSGSSATRARSRTPTRSSSATRPTPPWARRPRPRSATGRARSSSA